MNTISTRRNWLNGVCLGVLIGFLAACGGGGGSGSSGGSGFEGIDSSARAEWMVENLADGVITRNVISSLSHGDYYNEVVNGLSGTATVSGHYYYTNNISCGSDCVRSQTDADIQILFDQYRVMSNDNVEAVVNGWVWYENDRWSRQSGYSYTSGGTVTVGTYIDNSVTYQASDIESGSFAYQDTIKGFVASGNSSGYLSGELTLEDGTGYTF